MALALAGIITAVILIKRKKAADGAKQ